MDKTSSKDSEPIATAIICLPKSSTSDGTICNRLKRNRRYKRLSMINPSNYRKIDKSVRFIYSSKAPTAASILSPITSAHADRLPQEMSISFVALRNRSNSQVITQLTYTEVHMEDKS